MSKFRPLLGALVVTLTVLAASAAPAPSGGDPKLLLDDSAIRQAALKRAFETFRQKLALLAGRLENSASEQDRDRAAALRRALKLAGERGVDHRFETLVRGLTARGADQNLDLLSQIVRDNKELRQDLRAILKLLTEDDRDKRLAQRREDAGRLLDRLREMRARQARLQALSERGKHDGKELARQQEKLTQQTREVLPPRSDAKTPAELVRKPVEQAMGEQQKAEGKLSKGQMDAAGGSQGRAVSRLDEAIRLLENDLRQTRQEERERALASLLARCRKMLAWQKEIRTGTGELERELLRTPDLLQQLKIIHAMQRRVHDRTGLYGKLYPGEQAPAAAGVVNTEQRRQYDRIGKELKDLAGRQERIGKATREIGKQAERVGRMD